MKANGVFFVIPSDP
jgi:hypothetical protein